MNIFLDLGRFLTRFLLFLIRIRILLQTAVAVAWIWRGARAL